VVDTFGVFIPSALDTTFAWYLVVRVFLIVIPMLSGGGLSYLFKKDSKPVT